MQLTKVVEWVDIEAPCEDVYALINDLQKRLQLSPLWGVTRIEDISDDFPEKGGHYRAEIVTGEQPAYETVITENIPERKLAYKLSNPRETQVTWLIGDTARGTRVTYEEEFLLLDGDGDEFIESVRKVIQNWLKNIKRYSELRGSRKKRLAKWLVDRYYLKLRPDQRRTVQMILFMHAIGFISFTMAAIAFGFARLVTGF